MFNYSSRSSTRLAVEPEIIWYHYEPRSRQPVKVGKRDLPADTTTVDIMRLLCEMRFQAEPRQGRPRCLFLYAAAPHG
ncbi:hypothetical protein EVAR_80097_1 [Eumeta japonica]|uniref:Uncharacterized protein n=1 Tax=Eumeta variegata TaxID=151549 RepID=A0A4C1UE85_EUMVA|nr:hypothetical protein EVAR_80097_1 [Eumeta japonica]